MKTLIPITSLLLVFAAHCHAQITTVASPKETEIKEVLKYDSLESLNYKNAPLHVGQTLFIKGSDYTKKNGFSHRFYTEMVTDSLIKIRNKNKKPNSKYISSTDSMYVYAPIPAIEEDPIPGSRTRFVSDYSKLVGKYYKIISVKTEKVSYSDVIYWIELANADNTSFYLKISSPHYPVHAFVTLGYYEKMKKTFVGKEFYSKGRYEIDKVDTKEKVTLPYKVKFKCTDIGVNVGEDGYIFAILENEKYGRMKGEIMNGKKINHFITVAFYNECIRKYGAKFGSYVAEGKIEIGMNKNMVRDAWGLPDNINKSTGSYGTHEQWVYGDRYLYFQNGKLTSTQL